MKKSFIILFSLFYLTVASGITINLHYCNGKLRQISFLNSKKEKGCCGSKMKSKGCCSDKAAFVKVNDNHHSIKIINLTFNHFKIFDATLLAPQVSLNVSETIFYNTLNYHAPPVLYDNPLYLKHRVLLI